VRPRRDSRSHAHRHSAAASRNLLPAAPVSHTATPVSTPVTPADTPLQLRHHGASCRAGASGRSPPPAMAVPPRTVPSGAGAAGASSAPTAIPLAGPGGRCCGCSVVAPCARPSAPSCLASTPPSSAAGAASRAGPQAWASGARRACARWPRIRCGHGWSTRPSRCGPRYGRHAVRGRQGHLDALFARLSALQAGEGSAAEAVERLERSPQWGGRWPPRGNGGGPSRSGIARAPWRSAWSTRARRGWPRPAPRGCAPLGGGRRGRPGGPTRETGGRPYAAKAKAPGPSCSLRWCSRPGADGVRDGAGLASCWARWRPSRPCWRRLAGPARPPS
jgi:hypothetical protein